MCTSECALLTARWHFAAAATKPSTEQKAESIRSQVVLSPLLVRPLTDQSFEIVAGARRYRAAQMAEATTVPVRIVNLSDAEALETQLIELSIVGNRFLCLYATSARRLYIIGVPGLPKLLDTTECRRPVQ
jgi:ParB-like chromosome segregation protein Spo0J